MVGWNVYGAGADEIVARWMGATGTLWVHPDKQGSVSALLNDSGSVWEKYSYDAYGMPTITDRLGNPHFGANGQYASWYGNRFMFTGREYLSSIAAYDYRHRMYRPNIGRFQTDPIGFDAGDMNLFRYCGYDPVDRSDPDGLDSDIFLNREYADRNAPGTYVIFNDKNKQIYSGPANQNPFYAGTHGVRAGDYTLQPKGNKWTPGRFPPDQPAITGNGANLKPGQPNKSYVEPALVHRELRYGSGPDSAACVTVSQEAVEKTKQVMTENHRNGGVAHFHIREPASDRVRTRRAESVQSRASRDSGGLGAGDEPSTNVDAYARQLDRVVSSYLMGAGDNAGEGVHPRGPR